MVNLVMKLNVRGVQKLGRFLPNTKKIHLYLVIFFLQQYENVNGKVGQRFAKCNLVMIFISNLISKSKSKRVRVSFIF